MPPHPIIALWTVPRSVSTAFERMMIERGDVTVVHEPFSLHYYFGPAKRSQRYEEVRPGSTRDEIVASLERAAADGPVFLKDMAYHVRDLVDTALVERITHTFLVRDPAWTLPSLARRWPDFTLEEAGFDALAELVSLVEASAATPVVVDSDDLRADPEGIVRAYCDAVGLPFLPETLEWEPGMPSEWDVWEDWHRDVADSRGFEATANAPPPPLLDAHARVTYDHCAPIYEHLRRRRLLPQRNAQGTPKSGL